MTGSELMKRTSSTQQSALAHERRLYEGQLARCDKGLRKWEQAYLADAIDVQDLKVRRAEVTARRTSLEHEMVRLDDQQRLLEQVALDTPSVAGLS